MVGIPSRRCLLQLAELPGRAIVNSAGTIILRHLELPLSPELPEPALESWPRSRR